MAISPALLTEDSSGTDTTSYLTASVTPAANKLELVAVTSGLTAGAGVPTVSGCGLTWTQIGTAIITNAAVRMTVFRAMGASPTSGQITITFGVTQSSCQWKVIEVSNVKTGGSGGSAAVVQVKAEQSSSANPVVTLPAAIGSGNGTLGFAGINSTSATFDPGSGYTRVGTHTTATGPSATCDAEYRTDGQTAVAWTTTSTTGKAMVAVEVAAAQDVTLDAALTATASVVADEQTAPAVATLTVTAQVAAELQVESPAIVLTNTAAGGASGAEVTVANSGGASGDPWDRVVTGASGAIVYDNTQTVPGSGMSIRQSTGATASEVNMRWDLSVGTMRRCSGRFFFRVDSLVADDQRHLVRWKGAGQQAGRIQIRSDGHIELRGSGGSEIVDWTDLVVSADTWYRVEWDFWPGTAQHGEIRVHADIASSIPTEVIVGTHDFGTEVDYIEFGQFSAKTDLPNMWLARMFASSGEAPVTSWHVYGYAMFTTTTERDAMRTDIQTWLDAHTPDEVWASSITINVADTPTVLAAGFATPDLMDLADPPTGPHPGLTWSYEVSTSPLRDDLGGVPSARWDTALEGSQFGESTN